MALTSRDYEDDRDLRLMQDLAVECARPVAPLVGVHVGDLPWWMYQHLNKLDEARVRLWLDGDRRARAWAWVGMPSELDLQVHPEAAEVIPDVLAWFETVAVPNKQGLISAWTLETNSRLVDAFGGAGYERRDDEWFAHHVYDLDQEPPIPSVPDGYTLRTVRGEEDLEHRVEVHRAAFAPSRVVPESYRRVMEAWPYRAELDQVVLAADGTFAAFCLCWLDEENRLGLFEPVGTHPDHRRRSLATAVCLAGLRSLLAAGADHAVVLSVGGSEATKLYESLGFETMARHVPYSKRPAAA